MTAELQGKTVIITGGAGLLGAAFSASCAGAGASVVIADRDGERSARVRDQVRKETGNRRVVSHPCDITVKGDLEELVRATREEFRTIDGLVNNAYPRTPQYGRKFEEVTYEDFCEHLRLHLGGYFLATQVVARAMAEERQGSIVNMGSIYGFAAPRFEIYEGTPLTMPVQYAAIKGGVLNLTRYLASYLGPSNIRVNAISPGGIFDNQPEAFVRHYSRRVVLGGRMGHPGDVTGALLFLLSDASRYVTGQNLVVDGGWSL
jgi:NAD(P)-dependent dehydrogenase (short-subunit alcohol dehydrogenase family)